METFGRYLAQQRELRGLSRKDVIRITKLSPGAVGALEEDRFDAIPARVFVVGYIRAYAICIGINPDETVLRYDEFSKNKPEVVEPVVVPGSAKTRFGRRTRIALLVVAVIFGAGLIVAQMVSLLGD